ncbi:tail fiber protein [Proteus phage Myduc]|uniref:Tail fiber protein n=1 Tax=Proteus phage Myduc TaxID=2650874 RepID=A0A5J6T7Q5_9CAUD|nr:tail fiber protein [Proteus phage Myduc]QFG06697.1 hypothetical protein CPT_Myduc_075 [Proteus phage Myduc]
MNRSKLNRIWAKDSDIVRRDPGDEKYNQGWIAEIPTYQVLNFLQYKIDMTLLAIAERGIAEWGSDVEYGNGSVAWDESDKTIYIATVGKPDRNKKPSSNPEHWAPSAIQVSRLEFDKITTAINNHIADVTSNPHKVTAGGIGAYTKAEINKIVDTYNALVASHANNKNNPHGTKAVDIGAVPVTGGKYTGNVIFDKGIFFDEAGKVKLRVDTYSDGSEVFLVNGDWLLGMYRSGKPVVGKTGAMAELITEKNFADFKSTFQGDYSIPTPTLHITLENTINVLVGTGNTEFLPEEVGEPFYADGGVSFSTGRERELRITHPTLRGDEFSFSFNFISKSVQAGPGNYIFRVAFESGKNALYILDNGAVVFTGTTDLRARGAISFGNAISKIACVQTKDNIFIYINGKLEGQLGRGNRVPNTGILRLLNHTESGKNNVYRISDFRYWDVPLSEKQISMI